VIEIYNLRKPSAMDVEAIRSTFSTHKITNTTRCSLLAILKNVSGRNNGYCPSDFERVG